MDGGFSRFSSQIKAAATLSAVREVFGATVRRLGFTAYAAGFLPAVSGDGAPPEPFLFISWPRAWLELYAREGFAKDDLLIAEAMTRTEPLTWAEFQALRPGASRRIFAAASEFGWEDGLLVPIRADDGGDGRVGVVSLAAPKRLAMDEARRAEIAAMARLAFARARAIQQSDRAGPVLTKREQAALSLVAQGYSDGEIGQELGISKDTSHLHVERAKRRLGATTRAQAVAIAMDQGLLGKE